MQNKSVQNQSLSLRPLIQNGPVTATKRLTRATASGLAFLALALPLLPIVATAGPAVTRPLLVVEGHLTITVELATGAYEFTDWGWASEVGLFSNTGSGGPGALVGGEFLSGSGTVIAANGDTLDWVVGPTPNVVSYTGGTGRFQGVTGGFLAVITSVTPLSATATTATLLTTYDGKGTITY